MKLQPLSYAIALMLVTGVTSAVEQVATPAPAVVGQAAAAPIFTRATTPEQQAVAAALSARVTARWAALAKRDFATAYTFETPAFRQLNDAASFAGRFGGAVKWQGAQVTEVKLDAALQSAKVALMLSYETVLPDGGNLYQGRRRMDETWIRVADQWWFAQSD
ncbi:hypothetical protein HUU61_11855 [Rhodopseudomonas palustris]|uniref:DUF4440 domain-containing protein n=1 Tax=Thiospirillum jenense TaxID=1653858 RepID=A0A839HG68_9GAMM|nr:hypothetical protein [Thiospirillum jenense]MBB1091986.1 hypothetical protein [Rhodopseudomonas palustris]MBB1126296.1 hypothetical protein [Thiospirillum jenense]